MPDIPSKVKLATERGRREMRRDAPKRRLCMRFERGDTYVYIDGKGALQQQATVTNLNGSGMPRHRIRNKYNFIRPIIEAKVSAATQRIPSYSCVPTGTDAETTGAAGLSEKVALFGYDQWRLRTASLKTVKLAIGGGGVGYLMPYWEPNVGPYTEVDGEMIGRGDCKALVLTGNECYGEAGTPFDDSPWYVVERARPLEDVRATPGFNGTEIAADALQSDIPTERENADNLVLTQEYFERPSPTFPDGRCMVMANGKPIVDYRLINPTSEDWWGPYPLQDFDGTVLDEPLIHRLVYTVDPENDKDFGLTWQLIDFERTIQDAYNKVLEWKNRCLMPQLMAPVGSLVAPANDIPGFTNYYRQVGGNKPEWETPPPVPDSLFKIIERALQDMRDVASDQNIDIAPNLAARTLQAGIEQNANRWQSFVGDLAEWHSRVMRHFLLLCSKHYTESRVLAIRGLDGWESIKGFRGAQLMGQTQVRVMPDSLTPLTRQGIQEKLTWIVTNFPGYLSPESAITALDGGNYDRMMKSYWLAVGRANRIIQKIKDGTVFDMPDRMDMQVDGTVIPTPSFMPSPQDNLTVWKQVFGDWMTTDDYLRVEPGFQECAQLIWAGIEKLALERAQHEANLKMMMAQEQGMTNAAAPQAPGVPSQNGSVGTPGPTGPPVPA